MRDSTSSARCCERVVDQVLNGSDGLLLRNLHGRGGNHVGFGEHWIFDAAAERVLHQQLLQLQIVLRHDQVLLVGGDRALRAHDLNGRHGADLRLTLGIVESLLRIGQGFLLHPHILVGIDQIPIHVFDLIDGGDDLQAEGNVGDFAVVLGDADEARVGKRSEALQQILRELELKVRAELRREQSWWGCWW